MDIRELLVNGATLLKVPNIEEFSWVIKLKSLAPGLQMYSKNDNFGVVNLRSIIFSGCYLESDILVPCQVKTPTGYKQKSKWEFVKFNTYTGFYSKCFNDSSLRSGKVSRRTRESIDIPLTNHLCEDQHETYCINSDVFKKHLNILNFQKAILTKSGLRKWSKGAIYFYASYVLIMLELIAHRENPNKLDDESSTRGTLFERKLRYKIIREILIDVFEDKYKAEFPISEDEFVAGFDDELAKSNKKRGLRLALTEEPPKYKSEWDSRTPADPDRFDPKKAPSLEQNLLKILFKEDISKIEFARGLFPPIGFREVDL
jgi:hypothetical protein